MENEFHSGQTAQICDPTHPLLSQKVTIVSKKRGTNLYRVRLPDGSPSELDADSLVWCQPDSVLSFSPDTLLPMPLSPPEAPEFKGDGRCKAIPEAYHARLRSDVEFFDSETQFLGRQELEDNDFLILGLCRGCGTTVSRKKDE